MTYFLKDCDRKVSPPAKKREDIARAAAETFATRPYIRFAVFIEPYADGSGDDSVELIRNRARRKVSRLGECRCGDRLECVALPPHECRPHRQACDADGRAVPSHGHLGIRRQGRPVSDAPGHSRQCNRVRCAVPQELDGGGRRAARSLAICRRMRSRHRRRGCAGGGVPCEPIRRQAARRWPSRLPYRGTATAAGSIRQIM